jgi:outer membrane protein OmpA-like peptidoglycan-associated protein
MIGIPVILAIGLPGCATRRYVRNHIAPVDQRVTELDQKTSEQIQALNTKHDGDVSRLDERISTTDNRVAEVASVAQQASLTANQANQIGQANRAEIQAQNQAMSLYAQKLSTYAQNAWEFQMIEKGDVTFAFNSSKLDSGAKAALDVIAAKAKSMPRTDVNLAGFTDKVGSPEYNLALSRRRAEAVQRYLVLRGVPLQNIHIIGLGEENPPSTLAADFEIFKPNATPQELRRLARRVYIRIYAPATSIGAAARAEP